MSLCVNCHQNSYPGIVAGDKYYCLECWNKLTPIVIACNNCLKQLPLNEDICDIQQHRYCQECIKFCKYCHAKPCCYLCVNEANNYGGPYVDGTSQEACCICSQCMNICTMCDNYFITPGEKRCYQCL